MKHVVAALFISCLILPGVAQPTSSPHKPMVVSPMHPKDSLGETVYDEQETSQSNVPIVPGIFVFPELLIRAKVKIPLSVRLHHRKINIMIEGVVTAKGDVIDVQILQDDGVPALAENCATAVRNEKFKPATLNGSPVALLVQVPCRFNVI